MTVVASQSIFSHVEEENLPALKAYLDKHRDVDSRSDVSEKPWKRLDGVYTRLSWEEMNKGEFLLV